MKSIYKKKAKPLPHYIQTPEQIKWWTYCVKNNIRISPHGILGDSDRWHIAINLGPYKQGEKPNLSPSKYCRKTIWPEFYEMCKYYYDKRK